jgi:Zn-dependent membrane protease YugP
MWWTLGFVVAGIVVAVVAVLLLGILMQARRIRALAGAAIGLVGEIDANTRSVWALKATNQVAGQILDGAQAIDRNAAAVAAALTGDASRADAA